MSNKPVKPYNGTIPLADLERARRKMKRRVVSALIRGMAETDVGFDLIAVRLDAPETKYRQWVMKMIDGTAKEMDDISDVATALGVEMEFSLNRYTPPEPPAETPKDFVMTLIFIASIFLSASAGFVWGWAMGARMVRANYEALGDPTELHADAKGVSSRRDYRRPF